MSQKQVNIRNKKAKFEYHLLDVFTAGMQLTGTEIKSIRKSKASILEAYCICDRSEIWIRNMHITEYENGSFYNHKPRTDRKLLLNKKEIKQIEKFLTVKGNTLIPLRLFLSEKGTVVISALAINYLLNSIKYPGSIKNHTSGNRIKVPWVA